MEGSKWSGCREMEHKYVLEWPAFGNIVTRRLTSTISVLDCSLLIQENLLVCYLVGSIVFSSQPHDFAVVSIYTGK
jgi:hypothetical protein